MILTLDIDLDIIFVSLTFSLIKGKFEEYGGKWYCIFLIYFLWLLFTFFVLLNFLLTNFSIKFRNTWHSTSLIVRHWIFYVVYIVFKKIKLSKCTVINSIWRIEYQKIFYAGEKLFFNICLNEWKHVNKKFQFLLFLF